MTHQANGGIFDGANLGVNSDFVTITTVIAHADGNFGAGTTPTANLEKLMEKIQLLVNVKYIHVSSAVVDLSDAGARAVAGLGTNFNQAATTVYTIKFMTEQAGFLAGLAAALDGVAVPVPTTGVPHATAAATLSAYETSDAAEKNIAVVIADLF